MGYMFVETLEDIYRWYSTEEERVSENIIGIFGYGSATIIVREKISDEDVDKLLNPVKKTKGYVFARYIDGDPNSNSYPRGCQIIEYAIPFNKDAIDILNKYGMDIDSSWRTPTITVLGLGWDGYDLSEVYEDKEGKYPKLEKFNITDYRSTDTTIRIAMFCISQEQREYMLNRIKTLTGCDIVAVGTIANEEIANTIKSIVDRSSDWKDIINNILTGKMGVIKIENNW